MTCRMIKDNTMALVGVSADAAAPAAAAIGGTGDVSGSSDVLHNNFSFLCFVFCVGCFAL